MPKHPFDYHAPTPEQVRQIALIRAQCKDLHATLLTLPSNRERSIALTRLEEVSMWANKGIVMADDVPEEGGKHHEVKFLLDEVRAEGSDPNCS